MKKVLLFFFFVLCIGAGFSIYSYRYYLFQYLPATKENEQIKNKNGLLYNENDQLFTGRLRKDFDTSFSIYSYNNGELHGLNVVYSQGKIKEIGHWEHGKQNGLFQLYTEEGILIDNAMFKNGERHGLTEQYYPTGIKRISGNFDNGKKIGEWKSFYEDGKLYLYEEYKNNKREGKLQQFYPDGTLQVEEYYKNNFHHGKCMNYFPNGKKSLEGEYIHNKQNGIWLFYYDNGKLKMEVNYVDNVPQGIKKGYRLDGSLFYIEETVNGSPKYLEQYDEHGNLITPLDMAFPKTKERFLKSLAQEQEEIIIKEVE